MAAAHPRTVPRTTYFMVFAALLALTFVTYSVAYVNLGVWNSPIALAIAAFKASLVLLYFMHVRHSPKLTLLVLIASGAWLSLLLSATMADVVTRTSVQVIHVEAPPPDAGGIGARNEPR